MLLGTVLRCVSTIGTRVSTRVRTRVRCTYLGTLWYNIVYRYLGTLQYCNTVYAILQLSIIAIFPIWP